MKHNKTCKKYRTCEEVPCSQMKNGSPPIVQMFLYTDEDLHR